MEHKELKPCPFCGRTNQRFLMDMDIYNYPQNRGRRAIICDCGLRLYARDHGEAEKKWQDRLYDKAIKELIEENKRLRADTVREMQSEIKKSLSALCKGDTSELCRMIDQIAKEMTEGV